MVAAGPDLPPVDPSFHIYNSYTNDPPYQIAFTIVWTTAAAAGVLVTAPKLLRAFRNGRIWQGWGVWEDVYDTAYKPVQLLEKRPLPKHTVLQACLSVVEKHSLWKPPYLNLDLGQIFVLAGYFATLFVCIFLHSPIVTSPNRAGFLALAQLPAIFLFATKNGLLSILLGKGYEKLNFLHRWAGRFLFLSATIHGSLWVRNGLKGGTPIIGSRKETLGLAAYGILCILILSSLPIVRKYAYQMFFIIHVFAFVGFFVVICYHTLFSVPWIFPPLAFYGLDLFVRMIRTRIKDAILVSIDDQLTLIHVQNCDGGWVAGQHIRLRVFFSGRLLEAHPFSILNAPAPISCTSSGELILAARVAGDWTRALNEAARHDEGACRMTVMMDGPYGGSTVDIGEYESVLLIAGGSGVTFTLGLLDDVVGRVVNLNRRGGERTRRVEFVWFIKSFGAISWISPMLLDIAHKASISSLSLHMKIFVTCLCDPEAVPEIPNCDVAVEKPKVVKLLGSLLGRRADVEADTKHGSGGIAIAVSGPKSLICETQNAVAGFPASRTLDIGGLALHTEIFSL